MRAPLASHLDGQQTLAVSTLLASLSSRALLIAVARARACSHRARDRRRSMRTHTHKRARARDTKGRQRRVDDCGRRVQRRRDILTAATRTHAIANQDERAHSLAHRRRRRRRRRRCCCCCCCCRGKLLRETCAPKFECLGCFLESKENDALEASCLLSIAQFFTAKKPIALFSAHAARQLCD